MDRDENYESMLALGSKLESERTPYSSIRLSLISEMAYRFKARPSVPFCVTRKIRDAYPPVRHGIQLKCQKKDEQDDKDDEVSEVEKAECEWNN
jgi:hypothetical protein